MKYNTLYSFILAVFLAVALAVSCSKADPESEGEPAPQVYTMAVNASRVYTRALEEDTSATSPRIVSTWTAGDVITVWTSDGSSRQYGQLSAQTSGSSTTFSGTLTSLPSDGEELLLKYLSNNYSRQDGTLTGGEGSIDKVCDYATATVTATVDGTSVTTTNASFANQQSIVRFRLKDKSNDYSDLYATGFSMSINGETFTAIPSSATNVFYLAIPGRTLDMVPLTLTATTGSKIYRYSHNGNFDPTSFVNGTYYTVSVALEEYGATNTLEWLKIKAAFGEDCSGWLGWYVRPDGSITYSKPSDAVGRITFISSSSDVEVAAPGSRILVLSLESAGGADASFVWKPSASMSDRIDPAFADASAMNGLAICTAYHSDDYPALKAAWEYATARPDGASGWFLPSKGQFNAMMPKAREMLQKNGADYAVYWSSTTVNTGAYVNYAWFYVFYNGEEQWGSSSKTTGGDGITIVNVRPCFAY